MLATTQSTFRQASEPSLLLQEQFYAIVSSYDTCTVFTYSKRLIESEAAKSSEDVYACGQPVACIGGDLCCSPMPWLCLGSALLSVRSKNAQELWKREVIHRLVSEQELDNTGSRCISCAHRGISDTIRSCSTVAMERSHICLALFKCITYMYSTGIL